MKNRRLKIWPVIILLVCIILIICIFSLIKSLETSKPIKNEIIDTIQKYDYSLKENKSDYYKSLFKELKEELSKKNIDEEKYASTVSKLFVTDLYSLKYSINKNDIGGIEYIYKDYKDNFISKAKDTLYKNIESNIYGDRKLELPIVKNVEIISINKKSYDSETVTDNEAYYVEIKITYIKNLGYPKKNSLILVHNDNKLEIVKVK